MKRIPKTIKIGAQDYEVVHQPRVFGTDGEACNACIDSNTLKIHMESGLKRQKKQVDVTHEAIHGLFEGYPFDDDELEEKIVSYIAPKLVLLIRDNPELISYLTT